MNERKLHRFCLLLLICAICVRALCAASLPAGVSAAAGESAGLRVQTKEQPEEDMLWVVRLAGGNERDEPASALPDGQARSGAKDCGEAAAISQEPGRQEEPLAEKASLVFTDEEADAITIAGGCSYSVDKRALLQRPSQLDFSQPGPKVLIVHTHSCEAYTQEAGWEYTASDPLRTTDAARSVIRVGDEIAAALNARGIETLHDTALNDYPSYAGAYARMESTVAGYLAACPSIQMVIDVHRDAADDADGNPVCLKTAVNGEDCAQLMLVVGTDEGGLEHAQWQENLANALKLQALLNRAAPGLCRDLDLRTERFNQHLTKGSVLCEFGATGNTLLQAIRSGRLFAAALAELIESLPGGASQP